MGRNRMYHDRHPDKRGAHIIVHCDERHKYLVRWDTPQGRKKFWEPVRNIPLDAVEAFRTKARAQARAAVRLAEMVIDNPDVDTMEVDAAQPTSLFPSMGTRGTTPAPAPNPSTASVGMQTEEAPTPLPHVSVVTEKDVARLEDQLDELRGRNHVLTGDMARLRQTTSMEREQWKAERAQLLADMEKKKRVLAEAVDLMRKLETSRAADQAAAAAANSKKTGPANRQSRPKVVLPRAPPPEPSRELQNIGRYLARTWDFYQFLGIKMTATDDEVRRAVREALCHVHQDKLAQRQSEYPDATNVRELLMGMTHVLSYLKDDFLPKRAAYNAMLARQPVTSVSPHGGIYLDSAAMDHALATGMAYSVGPPKRPLLTQLGPRPQYEPPNPIHQFMAANPRKPRPAWMPHASSPVPTSRPDIYGQTGGSNWSGVI